MSRKMGFWSVLALVVGSQVGSSVFTSPSNLAGFGLYSIWGWLVSSLGAISLALVFANLCKHFPKTGGPHVYVEKIFGKLAAFFTGWTYWVVSWVSTTTVILTAISCLEPFLETQSKELFLILEIILLLIMSGINLYGVGFAGRAETIFTLLKFIPLVIVPIFAINYFDYNNFQISSAMSKFSTPTIIANASLLTLWGFIGLESATTPAGSVVNPSKTIPKALVIGTIIVAALYIFNSVAIMGLFPGSVLQNLNAPYVDAAKKIFSGQWYLSISVAASIICIGTLNAWILTAGQISLGLAEDKLLPKIFAKCNKNGAPYISIIISCAGIIPLLIITSSSSLADQVAIYINYSVTAFLYVYLMCSVANLVVSWRESLGFFSILNSVFAFSFCLWVIAENSLKEILISLLFTVSAIPIYLIWYKKQKN